MSSAPSDRPDIDVNDGLVDVILPTRLCWRIGKTPESSTGHGPHTFDDLGVPRRTWRCPGYPLPDIYVHERTDT